MSTHVERRRFSINHLSTFTSGGQAYVAAAAGPDIEIWRRQWTSRQWQRVYLKHGGEESHENVVALRFCGDNPTNLIATFLGGYFWQVMRNPHMLLNLSL